jgi:hypothetical protein
VVNPNTFREWPKVTFGRTGKPTFKKPKKPKKKCLEAATYASTAIAEASGDNWCDGARITITGGPVFIYREILAVSGYSGLIHEEPYGSGFGVFDDVTVEGSETEASDPDDWVSGWTDGSTPTVELDVFGGLSRLKDPTVGAAVSLVGPTFSTAGAEGFNILDRVSADVSSVLVTAIRLFHRVNIDASNVVLAELRVAGDTISTNWRVTSDTDTDSGVSRETESRIYFYIKDGRQACWFDDGATPTVIQTDTRTFVETTNGYVTYQVGATNISQATLLLGVNVFGNMTTV